MYHKTALKLIVPLLTVTILSLCPALTAAQNSAAVKEDEKALRELVRQENEGKKVIQFTEESIFVSDLIPRPIIGLKERQAARPAAEKNAGERPNQTRKTEIVRLVVSGSGDMAEEFGNFTINWDGPDKKRTGFEGSYLRVWRKIDNKWKVDAHFARPNRSEPEKTK
jgi:ketosteroid isomerase-like protein